MASVRLATKQGVSRMSINVNPKNQDELVDTLDQIRGHLEASAQSAEAFQKAAADIESARAAQKDAADAVRIAKNAEDIAKAMHESTRGGDDASIGAQLRNLPRTYSVARDKDWSGRVDADDFNLLSLTNRELAMYLDGAALAAAKRYRRLNDAMLTAHTVMRAMGDAQQQAYQARGGMKSLPFYKPFADLRSQFNRAISATGSAGFGVEWDPTLYSSSRLDDVKDQLEIASAFQSLPMPHSPWAPPFLSGSMTAYVHPEATSDTEASNTAITASSFTTSAPVFTAKTLAVMGYWSREADQESITPLIPVFDQEVAYALAYGFDNGVLNGQSTATIDTGDDPATTDPRDVFDGLRYGASLTGKVVDFGGSVTVESLAAMVGKAGKYAQLNFGRFFTGYTGLARLLVLKDSSGNVLNLTRDRAGADATLFSGSVGVLLGYPLSVGGVYPQNMNASGRIDAVTTTKTGILFANTNMYRSAMRQNMQVEVSDHFRFNTDQRAVKATMRPAFRALKTPAAASPFVVEGVNIPTF